jgi:hypothetical protein
VTCLPRHSIGRRFPGCTAAVRASSSPAIGEEEEDPGLSPGARRRLAALDLEAGWFCGPWFEDCQWPDCDCYPAGQPIGRKREGEP